MSIPAVGPTWASLSAAEKRERLLRTAGELFETGGFDTPMPAIAAAAGAGVGSLYRQFAHKDDLIAALAVERLTEVAGEIVDALGEDEAWPALVALIRRHVGRKGSDRMLAKAIALSQGRPDVELARARIWRGFDALLDRARSEGRVRTDASTTDLRLLFTAATAVEELEPGASLRLVDVLLDGLERR
ncbi:MAG TPA: TetR family transcriptional regulator [Gaiellaceae bacterium]|jgi:AcrR family transcriptional regulator|nr:TetR family transcriptional regulator [Gaiellaceae bacterium]